jgi:serine/threonine protein phosphatase PrpC
MLGVGCWVSLPFYPSLGHILVAFGITPLLVERVSCLSNSLSQSVLRSTLWRGGRSYPISSVFVTKSTSATMRRRNTSSLFGSVSLLLLILLIVGNLNVGVVSQGEPTYSAGKDKKDDDAGNDNNLPFSPRVLECHPWGCPLLPFDVVMDPIAQKALEDLRSSIGEDKDGNEVALELENFKETLELLSSAGDADKTTMTLQGDKGGTGKPINQDRAMIYSPFQIPNNTKQTQLLGVFDGHGDGGELTSQHAVTMVPKLLSEQLGQLSSLDDTVAVSQIIKNVFLEVDQTDPSNGEGGCTASIILQLGNKIYVGNAGDSKSFIAVLVEPEVEVVYESREDKPDLPDERARIIQMGGFVLVDETGEDVPRAYYVDADGRPRYGLAMSRSLGDWTVQGVIAEPIVDVLDVSELVGQTMADYAQACADAQEEWNKSDENSNTDPTTEEEAFQCEALDPREVHLVAVSATDGLLDFLQTEQIAFIYASAFFIEGNPHPHLASEFLIVQSAEAWNDAYQGQYRDDIAVAAVKIFSDDSILAESAKSST